ncbi:concanavalin A-like lectin/glucanase domain-containing protein [Aspergillus karnatakaensis]|uniref:concanavalin A-like lectin/glucanase domain-containing protein n=1 Tax=Aspergillus karnatakaensis TaxID=1810916 RepID=UPI003CCE4F2A
MRYNSKWSAIAVAAAIQSCAAQTYTDCNPLTSTCNPDNGLSQWSFETDLTTGDTAFDGWTVTSGTVSSTTLGAEFVINQQGDAPTIASDFYIFFGYLEVTMRAANGTGIVSTAILQSDDLDEIDWEQVSTFNNQVQTNYFGKGNTTSYDRGTTVAVTSPSDTFHTYGISWTAEKTEWFIDGASVRTLYYEDALGGANYPQTPMQVRIGIWAGGDPNNAAGTIQWAGGETDYTQGPFTMYVESVKVINYNPAESYTYTDNTGSFSSISLSNATDNTSSGVISGSSSSSVIPTSANQGSSTGSVTVIPTSSIGSSSTATTPVISTTTPSTWSHGTSSLTLPTWTPSTNSGSMSPGPATTSPSVSEGTVFCVTRTGPGGMTQSASAVQESPDTSTPTAFFNSAQDESPSKIKSISVVLAAYVAAALGF